MHRCVCLPHISVYYQLLPNWFSQLAILAKLQLICCSMKDCCRWCKMKCINTLNWTTTTMSWGAHSIVQPWAISKTWWYDVQPVSAVVEFADRWQEWQAVFYFKLDCLFWYIFSRTLPCLSRLATLYQRLQIWVWQLVSSTWACNSS